MIGIINLACVILTVMGSMILAYKGDKIIGWYIYTVAAIFGVIYMVMSMDYLQLIIWIVFLINDIVAIRRKRNDRGKDRG